MLRLKPAGRLGLFFEFALHVVGATVAFFLVLFVSVAVGATVEWLGAHGWLHGYQRADAEWAEWGISRLDLITLSLYVIFEAIKLARGLVISLVRNLRGDDD